MKSGYSGVLRLFLGLALLIGITLLTARLSQMGGTSNSSVDDDGRKEESRRMLDEQREARSRIRELRQAKADMRDMQRRRHQAGLRPVEQNQPDSAEIEKRLASRKSDPATANLRNAIRYKIVVHVPKISAALSQLKSAATRAGLELPGNYKGESLELMVPQAAYLKFVDDLQSMGKLDVDQIRYRSDTPADAPIPIEISIVIEHGGK